MRLSIPLLLAFVIALIVAGCGDDSGEHQMPNGSMSNGSMSTATTAADHQMGGTPMSARDMDLAFIDSMIPHHQSAIDMAEVALEEADHQEIKDLAQAIITAQQAEIDQLAQWRMAWFGNPPQSDGMPGMENMTGMAMSEGDMQMLRDADPFDKMFIDMMIPHHESAIEMARMIQEVTARPELQQLAGEIITAQEGEIAQMEQWRTEWFGQ